MTAGSLQRQMKDHLDSSEVMCRQPPADVGPSRSALQLKIKYPKFLTMLKLHNPTCQILNLGPLHVRQ
jgi:hypothetical protein